MLEHLTLLDTGQAIICPRSILATRYFNTWVRCPSHLVLFSVHKCSRVDSLDLNMVLQGAALAYKEGRESDAKTARFKNIIRGRGRILIEVVYDSFGVKPLSQPQQSFGGAFPKSTNGGNEDKPELLLPSSKIIPYSQKFDRACLYRIAMRRLRFINARRGGR